MLGSIQIGTVRGIPIRIHFTLFVLFAIFVHWAGPIGALVALVVLVSTFLHELGHALVAQRQGVQIASIELHLLGGMAMAQAARLPGQELAIALAGPAVSLALGLAGSAASYALGLPLTTPRAWPDLLPFFGAVNLGMAVFNLIPALPMDGGRVLRALLARRRPLLEATELAARVSRMIALSLVLLGAVQRHWLVVVFGVVIYWLAGREVRAARRLAWLADNEARARALMDMLSRTGGLRELWPPPHARPQVRRDDPAAGPIIDI